MDSALDVDISEMIVRQETRATIDLYFNGFDSRNEMLILDCFAYEASAVYHHGTDNELTLVGLEQMAEYFRRTLTVFSASWHSTSNFRLVEFSSASARTDTFAIANLVVERRIVVRGIRYHDEFINLAGQWKIMKRQHCALWQYEANLVDPIAPGRS